MTFGKVKCAFKRIDGRYHRFETRAVQVWPIFSSLLTSQSSPVVTLWALPLPSHTEWPQAKDFPSGWLGSVTSVDECFWGTVPLSVGHCGWSD